ncbi:MAG TPA: alpha/beta hydrolase-fold protein [Micropepsaceae bacterium]|nr:alpha/beta hydrolase-fold protein [Micropepsaceae bacterium]
MRRDTTTTAGTVRRLIIDSEVLEANPLGDPANRIIDVYLPAGHSGDGLPLLVDLVGFTAGGPAHTNWRNFTENVPEQADRLIASGVMPPCVIAFPDCFTKLGGNQYINSAGIGRWADFLLQEAVPLVESTFHCGGTGKRGLFGKSSGGYGAIVHALLYPDFWSASACHSGDMGFELLNIPELPRVLRAIAKQSGSIKAWLEGFFAKRKVKDDDIHILMMLAMCATYDPDPGAFMGVRLPVDAQTCEFIPERWANWMKWDPLTLVETHHAGLKRLKALFIDCGDIDQYNLVYGARRMHRALERYGVLHVYEEFPDDHSSIDYRMDRSLPVLAKALSA